MMIVACKEFAVHQTKKGGKRQITPSTWGGGEGKCFCDLLAGQA
jgi:hypothetical protein